MTVDSNEPQTDVQAFIALALSRFQLAAEAEMRQRRESLEDLRFRAGDQWPEDIRAARDLDKRPCLTVNRLPQFLKQVCNEQRQNRPAIQVSPVDDYSDKDTAEIHQGLIRHIEQQSDAAVAWDTAFEHAATMGFGYVRLLTDYCSDDSFDQEARFAAVPNPFKVYLDPSAVRPDRSDMQWGFIVDDVSPDDFKRDYPDAELAGIPEFSSLGDRAPGWISAQTVRVAEYFYIEYQPRTLALLDTGESAWEDELQFPDEHTRKQIVKKTRVVKVPTVKWAKINAIEILEERTIPGRFIPIIPVFGDELNIDGERQLVGLVRYAKDPQRAYNFWVSAETEVIALAPRAPFIGAAGAFEGFESQWANANTRNQAYLQYNAKVINGVMAPAPARNSYEPPILAISQARMQAAEDLKATTGIYDASLGANGKETSGRAILARQQEGDTANFHYIDNLSRAIKHAGRILLDLIPRIYDAPRVLRILGEDMAAKTVKVNQPTQVSGVEKIYDLTTGKYDVIVSVGPSYLSKRQAAVESMLELTKAFPDIVPIAGDLLVKNMDWPGATQIAERLKKMLPPHLQDKEDAPDPARQAQQAQQQLAQQGQMLQQMTAELQQLTEIIQTKKLETDSRERIAAMQAQVELIKTQATLSSKDAQVMLQAEMTEITSRLDRLTAAAQIDVQQMHESTEAAAAREAAAAAAPAAE